MIKSYKELEAYKKGYDLVKAVYEITKNFPKDEMYGLISQMKRCAISIPSNIAEGYMRGSKEYIQFLKVSLGSCAELETQLSLSQDLGFCSAVDFIRVNDLNTQIIKLLRTYINKITNRFTLTATR